MFNIRGYLLQQRVCLLKPLLAEEQHDLGEDEEASGVECLVEEGVICPGLEDEVS